MISKILQWTVKWTFTQKQIPRQNEKLNLLSANFCTACAKYRASFLRVSLGHLNKNINFAYNKEKFDTKNRRVTKCAGPVAFVTIATIVQSGIARDKSFMKTLSSFLSNYAFTLASAEVLRNRLFVFLTQQQSVKVRLAWLPYRRWNAIIIICSLHASDCTTYLAWK